MTRSSIPLPPGPSGLPWVGSALAFARDPLGFMQRAARRYGDVVSVRFGFRSTIWLNHPRLVEEVLVGRHQSCVRDPALRELAPALGQGLLTSEGELWRAQRRLASAALSPKRVEAFAGVMTECAARFSGGLRDEELRNIHADVLQLALEIVGRTLLGCDLRGDGGRLRAALDGVIAYVDERLFSPVGASLPYLGLPAQQRYRRARRELEGFVAQIVSAARREAGQSLPVESFLADWIGTAGEGMSERRARDETVTLLLAGHETTALAITYALYALSQEPACQARVRAELEPLGAAAPSAADLERLPYLNAVVREALRLYPPGWLIAREVASPFPLAGYEIPVGTALVCSPYVLQRDPRFFREPLRFLPERWLETGRAGPPRYAYIPFGAGPRSCIGSHFATLAVTLVLATVLQQVKLQVVPGYRLELAPSMMLRPRHGLPVIVRRLRPAGRSATYEAGVAPL